MCSIEAPPAQIGTVITFIIFLPSSASPPYGDTPYPKAWTDQDGYNPLFPTGWFSWWWLKTPIFIEAFRRLFTIYRYCDLGQICGPLQEFYKTYPWALIHRSRLSHQCLVLSLFWMSLVKLIVPSYIINYQRKANKHIWYVYLAIDDNNE